MRIFTVIYSTLAAAIVAGAYVPSIVYAQQTQPTEIWWEAITGERIFSLTFVLVVIGIGRFINGQAWPWFTKYFETRQRYEHEFKQEQHALTRDILQTMSNVSFSLGKVIGLMEQIKQELGGFVNEDT